MLADVNSGELAFNCAFRNERHLESSQDFALCVGFPKRNSSHALVASPLEVIVYADFLDFVKHNGNVTNIRNGQHRAWPNAELIADQLKTACLSDTQLHLGANAYVVARGLSNICFSASRTSTSIPSLASFKARSSPTGPAQIIMAFACFYLDFVHCQNKLGIYWCHSCLFWDGV